MCGHTDVLAKTVATLGNVEENDTISRALARLSEVEEKVEDLHVKQVGPGWRTLSSKLGSFFYSVPE